MRNLILLAPCIALASCSAMTSQRTTAMTTQNPPINHQSKIMEMRQITIELLALDLATCGRCTGTEGNLDSAIQTVAAVFRETGAEVNVRKVVVTSAAQAEQFRFESSPTIRINGRDIAFELRQSNCGDCGDLCGCTSSGAAVDCRVWVWRGEEYTEAPRPLIIDALLRAYVSADESSPLPATPFRLPDNLKRFFEAMDANQRRVGSSAAPAAHVCCRN